MCLARGGGREICLTQTAQFRVQVCNERVLDRKKVSMLFSRSAAESRSADGKTHYPICFLEKLVGCVEAE